MSDPIASLPSRNSQAVQAPPHLPNPLPPLNDPHTPQQTPAGTLPPPRNPFWPPMPRHQTRQPVWLRRRPCLRRSPICQTPHLPHPRAGPRHRPAQPIPQSILGRRVRRDQGRPAPCQTHADPGHRVRRGAESRPRLWPHYGPSRSR